MGLLRLVAQGLVGVHPGTTVDDVVPRLTAVQAQDLPGALVSVALRTASRSCADVVAALDAGRVVRTWPMRGTLHLVAADDLRWLLATTAGASLARAARRREQLGIDERTVARATDAATAALSPDGSPGGLTRAALLQVWEDAGLQTAGGHGYHLLAHLAQTGHLCLGPVEGREQLVVLVDSHVPGGRDLTGDDALGELALRYLRGHGPATLADLVRWTGLTVRQARTGVARARGHLAVLDVDGTEHLMDADLPDRLAGCRAEAEAVLLLPGFDEYLLGYAERGAVLDPAHLELVVPGRNGVFRPTVVDAGRVVGTWRHGTRRDEPAVVAEPFTTFAAHVVEALPDLHARLPRPWTDERVTSGGRRR